MCVLLILISFLMIILVGVSMSLFIFLKIRYTYWQKRNIPYIKPTIPFGNFYKFHTKKTSMAEISRDLHRELKSKHHKYGGLFYLQTPVFMPIDPMHVKQILLTDFQYFSERGTHINEETDPLSAHLFHLPTERWRLLRAKLTSTFTTGKLKMYFNTMEKLANNVLRVCDEMLLENNNCLDINDIAIRYTVDNTFSIAYGLESDSVNNSDDKFKKLAEKIINIPFDKILKIFTAMISPEILIFSKSRFIEKDVHNFFLDIIKQTIHYREQNNIVRDDFLQSLIKMKQEDEKLGDKAQIKMTWLLAAAQAFIFFLAGFETTSVLVTFCLYELSKQSKIQKKVQQEIRQVLKKCGNKITYDGFQKMVYFNQVIQETLRKYPPLGILNRECMKNYNLPNTNVVIEKGTKILISIWALQMDPEYFPNPEKFDPERFSNENKTSQIPFTHLPFGEGQRICMGARYGLIQSKTLLVALLNKYKFTLNRKTKEPILFRPESFVLQLRSTIWLNIEDASF